MQVNALASLQNTLSDVRSKISSRRQERQATPGDQAVSLNLSGRFGPAGDQADISFEEASSLVHDVRQASQASDSFRNVHSLDLERVLRLIG
ncbi:hypothetical protein DFW101_3003 [Solidesulfovibrio carbinoliphilus subsp. oakridgensis]|uniref:Uncharacterized protein n=1 Tax=Solidesulfovibrio carbinoliphilus subsp. oakridgensis TaxID=694327 RepID=G7Q746_9BACT|nr:hypothetical protein [Solidesulfovibrio carbinoliphilus]EHJ49003.1 hypothetical protein DFW101_3003 [Solidesulfovibrio carbinoliphilus subsp. oakridgensis]